MEERIAGTEDMTEKMDTSVTMKRPNLKIIGIEEAQEGQLKGPEKFFKNIIDEKFFNLKKEIPIRVKEAYSTPNRLDQERMSSPLPHDDQNTKHIEQ